MLSVKESAVLAVICSKCGESPSCLITIEEILITSNLKKKLSMVEAERIINGLEADGYFDVIRSERNGTPILCITLYSRGRGYEREIKQNKRDLRAKLVWAVVCGAVTFIVGRIMILIFT